jgi:hypothetical protein
MTSSTVPISSTTEVIVEQTLRHYMFHLKEQWHQLKKLQIDNTDAINSIVQIFKYENNIDLYRKYK